MTTTEQKFYEMVPKALMLIAEELKVLIEILKEDEQ